MSVVTSNPPARFSETSASLIFDLVRGLAAFMVLFEHLRNIFFIDYPQLTRHRLLLAPMYLISSAGHQAVIVFFLLSGYFIGGVVLRDLDHDRWQWSGYLLRRLLRLWIVLLPALLLCLFWDKVGIHLGHAPGLYSGKVANHIVFTDIQTVLAPHILFGNLFFLQAILTPVFGSDSALWSLTFEFWYYVLFPLGVLVLWRKSGLPHRLLCAAIFVATAWFVGRGILALFPIWLGGVALFRLPPPPISPRLAGPLRISAVALYLPYFLASAKITRWSGLTGDYILAALTFLLLWLLLSARSRYTPGSASERFSRSIARFSYTLYAVHLPLLLFLASVIVGEKRWSPSSLTILLGLGVGLLTASYAYLLAYFTEFRTDAVRRSIERILRIASPTPALSSSPIPENSVPPL